MKGDEAFFGIRFSGKSSRCSSNLEKFNPFFDLLKSIEQLVVKLEALG
jgi:hypothetical protein